MLLSMEDKFFVLLQSLFTFWLCWFVVCNRG